MESKRYAKCFWTVLLGIIMTCFVGLQIFAGISSKKAEQNENLIRLELADSVFKTCTVHIYGIEVDDTFFPAQEIFLQSGSEVDGSLLLAPESPTLIGTVPEGEKSLLIFEKADYRGDAVCTFRGNSYQFSTYGGYWEKGSIELTPKLPDATTLVLINICIYVLTLLLYLVTEKVFLKNIQLKLDVKLCLLIFSCLILTLILSANSQHWWCVIFSILISLPMYVKLVYTYRPQCGNVNRIAIVSTVTTVFAWMSFVRGTYSSVTGLLIYFGYRSDEIAGLLYVAMLPGLFYIMFCGCDFIAQCIKRLKETVDRFEIIFLLVFGVVYGVLICVLHLHTTALSTGLYQTSDGSMQRRYADIIYGFDHSWLLSCSSEISTNSLNIRHPLLRVLTVVPYSMIKAIASVMEPVTPSAYALLLSVFNMLLMLLTALLLRRISHSNWVAPIYSVTYFFMIMCLGMEQYQISIFLICLSVYFFAGSQEKLAKGSAVWMSGTTLTSGHLIPLLIQGKDFKDYCLKVIEYCWIFLSISAAFGAFPASLTMLEEVVAHTGGVNFLDRTKIFSHFVVWQFLPPNSMDVMTEDGSHIFAGVTPNTFNVLGTMILLLCVVYCLFTWKDKLSRLCIWSIAFSAVLCVGVGWGIQESWLYAILFSWAYVIVVLKAVDWVTQKNTIAKGIVYAAIFSCLLLYNSGQLRAVFAFAAAHYFC